MTLTYDPIPVLQSAGYTEREAAFLYLAALHSGYFLRRQYLRFIERGRGALAAQFLRRAFALGHIQSIACGQARSAYHLTSSEVYGAAGLGASHHRRLKSDATIKSRLMVLDFVLDHLGETLLDTEAAKVSHFTETSGLSESVLPRSRGVAFAEEFPAILNKDGGLSFSYIDEGALSASGFEHFLDRYAPLFRALPGFELLYLSDSPQNFERARSLFASKLTDERPGTTATTPRGVDHLIDYLRVRRQTETKQSALSLRDLAVLRDGDAIYTATEHQALIAAGDVERIRRRFLGQAERRKFVPVVLPYRYPLHHFRRERIKVSDLGSSQRSTNTTVRERQTVQEQLFSDGGDEW
ncbi:hypothetical protein HNQ77_005332 [Silvibacterium bohemicum]|uniref:Uncharacterized protein n=1 Tax=Silvibacterium bohemicum TaxID=1577686 RepID=A0A841K1A5_9BACT|nr:hypothetical protein [Silvibacterium bohemicum]MBB6147336.1 hypothetical protein [Silvibacterium bohemicum]